MTTEQSAQLKYIYDNMKNNSEKYIMQNGLWLTENTSQDWELVTLSDYGSYMTETYSLDGHVKLHVITTGTSPTGLFSLTSTNVEGLGDYRILRIKVTDYEFITSSYDTSCQNDIQIINNGNIIDSHTNIQNTGYYTFDISTVSTIAIRLVCGGRYSSTKSITFDEIYVY